jgi:hypothetical protein
VDKIGSPSAFRRSKGQDAGISQPRKLRNREKRSGPSIIGGHVVAIGAFGKSPERKVIHREIGNRGIGIPVDKSSGFPMVETRSRSEPSD